MAWKEIIDHLGGQPIYLPPRDPPEPPLLVLHDNGVALAEPLYDKIVPVLELMGRSSLIGIFGIDGESLLDPLESVVVGFTVLGVPITVSVFVLGLIIAGYIAKQLHKNVHRHIGTQPTAETAHELLIEYFGTDLIF